MRNNGNLMAPTSQENEKRPLPVKHRHVALYEAQKALENANIFAYEGTPAFGSCHRVGHLPPDPTTGRVWTIIHAGPAATKITAFDEETGLPVLMVGFAVDRRLTTLAPSYERAIINLAEKVLRSGG